MLLYSCPIFQRVTHLLRVGLIMMVKATSVLRMSQPRVKLYPRMIHRTFGFTSQRYNIATHLGESCDRGDTTYVVNVGDHDLTLIHTQLMKRFREIQATSFVREEGYVKFVSSSWVYTVTDEKNSFVVREPRELPVLRVIHLLRNKFLLALELLQEVT